MEILAPAGGFDAVVAAVQNGADAVYLGGKQYNARQHAENFDDECFAEAVNYCHLRGVQVHQTLNTLLYDEELPGVLRELRRACEVGVDALIVQDFGVLSLARKCCPELPLHGSTQMTVHTSAGAEFCRSLGLSRVVLARELSLAEIAEIARQTDIELEVFGHGALCMSVSGQCYMSAMIGTRSGNRGSCAGSCRLPFGCERPQDYDLSLKDLSAAAEFEALKAVGVSSLKIEGRMKRPEYVAAATAAYAALNRGKTPDLGSLEAVFSRSGFTDGYLTGKRDRDMFGVRGKEDVAAATEQIFTSLRQTYHKERPRISVSVSFTMHRGEPAKLVLTDGDGFTGSAEADCAEEAQARPTTPEMAAEALQKLGGTPFYVTNIDIVIDDGLRASKSALNELRRRAVELLSAARIVRKTPVFTPCALPKSGVPTGDGDIARFVRTEQVDWALWRRVILPLSEVWTHREELKRYSAQILIEPERVLFGRETAVRNQLEALKQDGYKFLAAGNPAHLQLAKELGYRLFGMPFLNCTNSASASFLAEQGVEELTLSFEMTAQKYARVQSGASLGAVVYGNLPLMVVRNCPVRRHGGCKSCSGVRSLTDRLGNAFPVRCVHREYAEVFNCKTLWLADRIGEFPGFHLFYFTEESQKEIAAIQHAYQMRQPPEGDFTRGLYYRKTT